MITRTRAILGTLVLSLCLAVPVQAAIYYSDTNSLGGTCSNSNPGTQTAPRCSVNAGLQLLSSGDTLYIRHGTYFERINPTVGGIPNGTSLARTIVAGYPGERPLINSTGIGPNALNLGDGGGFAWMLFQNIRFQAHDSVPPDESFINGVYLGQDTSHIRFDDIEVYNVRIALQAGGHSHELLRSYLHTTYTYGLYWATASAIVDGNTFTTTGSYAIHLFSNPPEKVDISDNIIRNNRFFNTGGNIITHGFNNQFYNNLVYDNYAGIQVGYNCHDCKVYNNTFFRNTTGGIAAIEVSSSGSYATTGTIVTNNLLYQNAQSDGIHDSASGTIQQTNFSGNPSFVDQNNGDFRLQPGSLAINYGTPIATFNTDYNGDPRGQGGAWDAGAYEFAQGGNGGDPPTANPIYVSGGGHGDSPSDSHSCIDAENIGTPKQTLTGMCACMTVPGKAARLRGGTYGAIDTLNCPLTGGTDWTTATRIEAHNAEPVTLTAPTGPTPIALWLRNSEGYLIFDHLRLTANGQANSNAVVLYNGVHHIRFQDVQLVDASIPLFISHADTIEVLQSTVHGSNTDFACIHVSGTVDGLLLRGNDIYDCAGAGVLVADIGSHANLVVSQNRLHRTGLTTTMPAVQLGPGAGARFDNNLLYDNDAGMVLLTGATGTKVYHNTVASTTGVGMQCNSGATGTELINNIAFTTGGGLLNTCGATDTTNQTTDPLFSDAAADDYTLQPTSAAIDTGTPLPAVPVAFDGVYRPQGPHYDKGAYERTTTPQPGTMGPLTTSVGNARYFARPDGQLVYLTGAYDWDYLFDTNMPEATAIAYLDFWVATGQNLIRAPNWDPTFATAATNPPFDTAFFAFVASRVDLARSKGIYVMFPVFTHVDQPPFTSQVYCETYVQQVVDVLGVYDNLLFETGNELVTTALDGSNVGFFTDRIVDVIKARQAANGRPALPVGISDYRHASGGGGFVPHPAIISAMLASSADFLVIGWSEVGTGQDTVLPIDRAGAKRIFVDSDHVWPYTVDHKWVWRGFMLGHNMQTLDGNEFFPDRCEDDAGNPCPLQFDARMRMGDPRSFALRMNLALAVPSGGLSTTGYALANPGTEYLVYQPGSGAFDLTVQQGTYAVEWWNASVRATVGAGTVTANGVTTFTPPFSGDAVLYLKMVPPPAPPVVGTAVQALMFF